MDRLKELKFRYRKAVSKIDRENDLVKQARDRRNYWKKQAKLIKGDIQLLIEGQLEFPF